MWTLHLKSRLMERIHSRGEDLCKFIGTKEVFLHKYGHRSVMWIHSIVFTIAFSAAVSHNYDHKQGILKHRNTQTGSKSTNHKSQTMTATLFRHLNEQGLFNDNNRDFKSCTLFVALFESFVERRPLLKHPCDGLFFFYLSSKRNWKFKLLVQTKPMGENTTTHTMKSIRSWY